jgi:hypothetical protein
VSSKSGKCRIGTKDPAPLPETISAWGRFIGAYPHVPGEGRASVEGNTSHVGTISTVIAASAMAKLRWRRSFGRVTRWLA